MAAATRHRASDTVTAEPIGSTIGRSLRRLESALEHNPAFGHATLRSVSDSRHGVQCTSIEGEHTFETDLPTALGGTATAPTPSALLRAALGSCLAIGYRLRAERHDIRLVAIRVIVETDSALAGMLVPDSSVPAGFSEIRYHVEFETDAPIAAVTRLVDEADRLSPVLDALRSNRLTRSLSIVAVDR